VLFLGVNEVVIIFRDILGTEDNFIFYFVYLEFNIFVSDYDINKKVAPMVIGGRFFDLSKS